MCERFSIKVQNSASFSPSSNRLCEWYNQTNILLKVKGNTKYNYDNALSWAVCAKNAMINNNGFTSQPYSCFTLSKKSFY